MISFLLVVGLACADTPTATETPTVTHTATATETETPMNTETTTPTATITTTPTAIQVEVCVGSTPVLLSQADPDHMILIFSNSSAVPVYVGDVLVTAGDGHPLLPGDWLWLAKGRGATQEWWGVVASGTACVRVSARSW